MKQELKNEYSKPVYLALPDIKKRDLTFYNMVKDISEPTASLKDKVKIAEEITAYLFGK